MSNPDPKPRLLVVTTTFPRWKDDPGPAPFVFYHARALLRHFEVTVLAPHYPGAAFDEDLDGVRVKRFQYAWPQNLELLSDGRGIRNNLRQGLRPKAAVPGLLASEFFALRRELRSGRYAYLNSHWLVPSGLLASLAVPHGTIKHLITVHAADYDLLMKIPGGKNMIKFMAERAAAVVGVNRRFTEGIHEIAEGARLVTQPMGVDTSLFRFSEEARKRWRKKIGSGDRPLILFVGKLSAKKGVEVLLEAAKILKETGVDFHLAIAGDGELADELDRLVVQFGLAERVNFLGAVPNREVAELYSAADVVAVPSIRDPRGETEGMPVVVLEALAEGRPVVATRLCGVPEELIGRGALEVPEGDSQALAQGLQTALAGETKVDQERVALYDVERVAEKYAKIFLEGAL